MVLINSSVIVMKFNVNAKTMFFHSDVIFYLFIIEQLLKELNSR
jgi:hypothetical protein